MVGTGKCILSLSAPYLSLREVTDFPCNCLELSYSLGQWFSEERHKEKEPVPITPRLMSVAVVVGSRSDELVCHRTEQLHCVTPTLAIVIA